MLWVRARSSTCVQKGILKEGAGFCPAFSCLVGIQLWGKTEYPGKRPNRVGGRKALSPDTPVGNPLVSEWEPVGEVGEQASGPSPRPAVLQCHMSYRKVRH